MVAPDADPWREASAERYVERYLYDLDTDPHELTNLTTDPAYARVRAELRERLADRIAASGERRPVITRAPDGEDRP